MNKVIGTGITVLGGILLAGSTIITGMPKLGEKDMAIYEKAMEMRGEAGNMGFSGYDIADYRITFEDGEHDYVINNGNVITRNPVMSTLAATAYPVDGEYEVIVPTVDRMSSIAAMASVGKAGYDENNQAATIWHESFHCYQLSNYYDAVTGIISDSIDESIIADEVDANDEAVELFTKQAKLLELAVNEDDPEKIKNFIAQYKTLEEQRNALLSDAAKEHEEYYTRIEGTAYYIESSIIAITEPELFRTEYIDTIDEYKNGSAKYYSSGMAICRILDKADPDWKDGYDFSTSLKELMFEYEL